MKKESGILITLALLLCSVIAIADDDITRTFRTENNSIAPPAIPDEEPNANKKEAEVALLLKDANTKTEINDFHADIFLVNKITEEEARTLRYVEGSTLRYEIAPGEYKITLKIDTLDSPGGDYYIETDISAENSTLFLLPVGGITGIVMNKNSDSIVRNAKVQFECSSNYGETLTQESDDFGSFSALWLPAGSCKISAYSGSNIGFKQVEIKKGEINDITLVLDKKIAGNRYYYLLILLVLLVMIGILLYYNYKLKKISLRERELLSKTKEEEKKLTQTKKELEEHKVRQRTADLMKTLNAKEVSVVKELLKNDFKSTQAKLKYSTGIPKTSLSRVFDSLLKKKVVKVEKIGKMKKIELTDWFIGKE